MEVNTRESGKPTMLLIHGYAAGGGLFYKILKRLAEKFHIFVLDLIGMGGSGRPAYTCQNAEECEEFYVESIQKARQLLQIEDPIVLAGHSMGGFLSMCYTLKYPESVKKLLLISPVGIPTKPEEWNFGAVAERRTTFRQKAFVKTVGFFWERHFTPMYFLRGIGPLGSTSLLRKFVTGRMCRVHNSPEKIEALTAYMQEILMRPCSGEAALHHLL